MNITIPYSRYLVAGVLSLIVLSSTLNAEEDEHHHAEYSEKNEHAEHQHEDEHEEGIVELSLQQLDAAGIKVSALTLSRIKPFISAPGKVVFNDYQTVSITPRITAQLIKRHVALGDSVKQGQAIATLSSVEMAETQANLLLNSREWQRVKKLGKKIVSEKRYTETRVKWQLAKARAIAYGMTEQQINDLVKTADFSSANGQFTLLAPMAGTVVEEEHIIGQQIESGQEINLITNESSLWILASVAPATAHKIRLGDSANILSEGHIYPATVSQISHSLDETTRMKFIRLSLQNTKDDLHSGLFVDTQIMLSGDDTKEGITLPLSAVVRAPDGDWQVMVQQAHIGEFKAVEIKVINIINDMAVIEGLDVGTLVVTEGAFFVQSELAKGNFEVHNH